ncbi:TPA: type VI secretion system ATPase TssH [Escherichia coli]|uniref:type VI secretion system ATPase TssH n=1 Tax=Escherichia coli TaxID=562 RepID=UPI0007A5E642|nr:type VI secretion system ATPase TssH [Escherichia coli]EFL9258177.1 type VI secretion system ATPase TssH [Escherichia coli]EFO4237522.1 type VI secretion system ATPase TssH [Escherichia coli]EIA5927948.1 type VI secretion system ATPase TssH [Escherichia coli]EKD5687029.1 type VI secretion system ATPase TssH [Escherichia coli]ELA5714854.1 type VI secretion system ATPase TssH [Escherichia coli]
MSFYLKQIVSKLTPSAKKHLDMAINLAVSRRHYEVDIIHLIYVIISNDKNLIEQLAKETLLNPPSIINAIEKEFMELPQGDVNTPVFSEILVSFIEKSWLHASTKWSCSSLDTPALFATVLYTARELLPERVSYSLNCQKKVAENILRQSCEASIITTQDNTLPSNSMLDRYTINLSTSAEEGRIDPVIGRENEIRKLIDILLRRRQNNPILTGEPGVGKTCIIEGLALRIKEGKVPETLRNVEVLTLDLTALLAGASAKGEFENRLQHILKEIEKKAKSIVLFIDEAHMLVGAGGLAGQTDAANLLKPALARGTLRVIAATTWSEYKKYFEKDAALARRFQIIRVSEPDVNAASAMLRALVPAFISHHNVDITEGAIKAATNLSNRYISGRKLPDKAVSLLDTACSHVSLSQVHIPKEIEYIEANLKRDMTELSALENNDILRRNQLNNNINCFNDRLLLLNSIWKHQLDLVNKIKECQDYDEINALRMELKKSHRDVAPMVFERVDETCIADVVSEWTGIPLGTFLETEKEKSKALLSRLQQRIIGQDYALSVISSQIEICQANLHDPHKPTGVYLFAGPSGIGKTETAHALAELVYGGSNNLITINMSEFQEAHSLSGLKGAPPGYVGFGHGGILTEGVKRNPFCVILLDEIEKAHPDVIELFYQVFDKGTMEDGEGQLINFRNTLIIMTSNLAASQLNDLWISGDKSISNILSIIRPIYDDFFQPAFMGRVNLIPFFPLSPDSLKRITKMKIEKICQRVSDATDHKIIVKYKKSLITWILENCKYIQSGAREIDMILNHKVLPLLAKHICNNDVNNFTGCLNLFIKNNTVVVEFSSDGE